MKILIICSKTHYDKIPSFKERLEEAGHEVFMPNCIDDPEQEQRAWDGGVGAHAEFKARMYRQSAECIKDMDGVLTLNYDKGGVKNYIGGATFLELYEAFMNHKVIYLLNEVPEGMLFDEISGMSPIILNGDISRIGK
jgi:hypothetical protein